MNLKPLYEEAHQFNYYNGTLLSDGKVEVWYLNRTRYADIYADVGGETPLPNPLELNNLGMQPVYVNPAFNYTVVVKDVYGNELYSIDKYMQAEGEHNMTNVVVQPSETVGVSAWTEGEVQIYQPYLSGDLGKTYSGIDPIVVNNDENKISAETVSFGVQEPLFFVKDDEEGCIIGCSAQTEIPSSVSGKWEEASDAVETNSAQWAQDTTYSAGANIDITDQVISVTGLQPSGDYATKDDLESGLSGKMDKSESANFYPMEGNPSGFLTTETDWTDTITAASSYAYEQATAAIPAPQDLSYISGQVDSKLPTSAFSTVSGDFITALPSDMATTGDIADLAESISETYQPKGDYLTTGDSAKFYTTANESGFITGVPDYLDIDTLTADEIIVTALVNPGDSENYGIDINPNDITITDRDGNYGSITTTAISDWNGVVNTVSTNSASWAEGGVDSATVSAIASDYAESAASGKLDTTAFNSAEFYTTANPSGFITGIPDPLTVNEIHADSIQITAQTAGESNPHGVWIDTAGISIVAQDGNGNAFIDSTTVYNWDDTYNTVTYNSASWAGGGDAYVSGFEYTTGGEISGYSGSAFVGGIDTSASEAIAEVTANSAVWNDTSDAVSSNSAAWGGEGIEISAGFGIDIQMVDNKLIVSIASNTGEI